MTQITIQIDDAKAIRLNEMAEKYGIRPDQLVTASIEDLLGQPDSEFDQAAKRVLDKYNNLYKRLS